MKKNTSWKFTDESSITFQSSISGPGEFGLGLKIFYFVIKISWLLALIKLLVISVYFFLMKKLLIILPNLMFHLTPSFHRCVSVLYLKTKAFVGASKKKKVSFR